jgi:hypothetical protein
MCWEKSKNRFGLNASKLRKNRWFFLIFLLGSVINKENVSKTYQIFLLFWLVHWCRSSLVAIMIQNISFLVENWWFYKKKWKKILIDWVTRQWNSWLYRFWQNFPALSARSSNLANFNQIFCVISSVLQFDSTFNFNSGLRILLISNLRRQ